MHNVHTRIIIHTSCCSISMYVYMEHTRIESNGCIYCMYCFCQTTWIAEKDFSESLLGFWVIKHIYCYSYDSSVQIQWVIPLFLFVYPICYRAQISSWFCYMGLSESITHIFSWLVVVYWSKDIKNDLGIVKYYTHVALLFGWWLGTFFP